LTKFRINEPSADARLLADLVSHPEYLGTGYEIEEPTEDERRSREEFLAGWLARMQARGVTVVRKDAAPQHGPYLLEWITANSLRPADAQEARAVLQRWVEGNDGWEVPPDVQAGLNDRLFSVLATGSLYGYRTSGRGQGRSGGGWLSFRFRSSCRSIVERAS
jgi:hypothetical protein